MAKFVFPTAPVRNGAAKAIAFRSKLSHHVHDHVQASHLRLDESLDFGPDSLVTSDCPTKVAPSSMSLLPTLRQARNTGCCGSSSGPRAIPIDF